jgi:hypothetical protein
MGRFCIKPVSFSHQSLSLAWKNTLAYNKIPTLGICYVMAPVLTHKHWTRLERLGRDKHASLLRTFTNYGRKKCCKIGPQWQTGREKRILSLTDADRPRACVIKLFTAVSYAFS